MEPPARPPLAGRRALVTGGTRGLGLAIATRLAEAGAAVAVAARRPSDEPHPRIAYEQYDAVDDAVTDVVDRVELRLDGGLDVVVHSAGTQSRGPAIEAAPDDWDRVLAVNLTAPFLLSNEIARRQITRGASGRHVVVASIASRLGLPNMVAYNSSKSGVLGVVRALAVEWAPHSIRVNAVGPGYVHTDLTDAVFRDERRRATLLGRIPMGRFGDPDDIAGPVAFLASDEASYVTGQLLMVDGGWTVG